MAKAGASASVDYVIAKKAEPHHFQVTKFSDDSVPLNVYNIVFNSSTGAGRCDCPAAAYRQTGARDKHVLMVKRWLERTS